MPDPTLVGLQINRILICHPHIAEAFVATLLMRLNASYTADIERSPIQTAILYASVAPGGWEHVDTALRACRSMHPSLIDRALAVCGELVPLTADGGSSAAPESAEMALLSILSRVGMPGYGRTKGYLDEMVRTHGDYLMSRRVVCRAFEVCGVDLGTHTILEALEKAPFLFYTVAAALVNAGVSCRWFTEILTFETAYKVIILNTSLARLVNAKNTAEIVDFLWNSAGVAMVLNLIKEVPLVEVSDRCVFLSNLKLLVDTYDRPVHRHQFLQILTRMGRKEWRFHEVLASMKKEDDLQTVRQQVVAQALPMEEDAWVGAFVATITTTSAKRETIRDFLIEQDIDEDDLSNFTYDELVTAGLSAGLAKKLCKAVEGMGSEFLALDRGNLRILVETIQLLSTDMQREKYLVQLQGHVDPNDITKLCSSLGHGWTYTSEHTTESHDELFTMVRFTRGN